jgi:hypothetical protein
VISADALLQHFIAEIRKSSAIRMLSSVNNMIRVGELDYLFQAERTAKIILQVIQEREKKK